ncbi:GAF domain-containing protein [Elusimicrobiota bacterium]
MLGLFHYQTLYEILREIHLFKDRDEIANFVLSKVAQALDSEGGTMFLVDVEEKGYLYPMAAYGAPLNILRQQKFPMGQGVVGWTAANKESVKVDDSGRDTRFYKTTDAKTGFLTKTIAAAPILFGNKVEGVIEFLNKRNGKYTDADLEFITVIGREIGAAIEKAMLREDMRKNLALEWAVSNMKTGILIADPNDVILLANPRAQEILRTDSIAVEEGASLAKLAMEWPKLTGSLNKTIETAQSTSRRHSETTSSKTVGYSCVPLADDEGTIAGAVCILQDITAACEQTKKDSEGITPEKVSLN